MYITARKMMGWNLLLRGRTHFQESSPVWDEFLKEVWPVKGGSNPIFWVRVHYLIGKLKLHKISWDYPLWLTHDPTHLHNTHPSSVPRDESANEWLNWSKTWTEQCATLSQFQFSDGQLSHSFADSSLTQINFQYYKINSRNLWYK